jgi:hypothetical protein
VKGERDGWRASNVASKGERDGWRASKWPIDGREGEGGHHEWPLRAEIGGERTWNRASKGGWGRSWIVETAFEGRAPRLESVGMGVRKRMRVEATRWSERRWPNLVRADIGASRGWDVATESMRSVRGSERPLGRDA